MLRDKQCRPFLIYIMPFLHKRQFTPFDEKFNKVAIHHVPAGWGEDMKLYLAYGIEPGRFHRCLYENDLYGATISSDSFNQWDWIVAFMQFIVGHFPPEAYGSKDRVAAWIALDDEKRFEICHKHNLLWTEQQVTIDILQND